MSFQITIGAQNGGVLENIELPPTKDDRDGKSLLTDSFDTYLLYAYLGKGDDLCKSREIYSPELWR